MTAIAIKGWCPSAWQPMQSGDGLVVRIRPHGGRIDADQAAGIAGLAERYGNGLIDVTNRANLQIRGVSDNSHPPLIDGLGELGLLDADPEVEAGRNILVTPFWTPDDGSISTALELERRLANDPIGLPTKFGFAVDCGSERVLAAASADIRIERGFDGQLIVRADGAEDGRRVTHDEVVSVALDLARWFVASGGIKEGRGRMAAHIAAGAKLPGALGGAALPVPKQATPHPGLTPNGALFGVALGQMTHTAMRWLAERASGLRMTPWRMLLAEGLNGMSVFDGLITGLNDPLLRVVACSGAPRCGEAHADTRALAAALAPHLAPDTRLHVSGCAKGCAQSGPAPITLVATAEGFDLVRGGSTRDKPAQRGLSATDILANPAVLSGAR
jgi:precorrin-3B synthase